MSTGTRRLTSLDKIIAWKTTSNVTTFEDAILCDSGWKLPKPKKVIPGALESNDDLLLAHFLSVATNEVSITHAGIYM